MSEIEDETRRICPECGQLRWTSNLAGECDSCLKAAADLELELKAQAAALNRITPHQRTAAFLQRLDEVAFMVPGVQQLAIAYGAAMYRLGMDDERELQLASAALPTPTVKQPRKR